jgi:transcriptional activator of cad operon
MPFPAGDKVQIGEWLVDAALDTISRGSEAHKLEPRTMRLLLCLADAGGAVVSVDRLLTEVWSGVIVGSASVYQAVSQLRKLLGDVDPEPTYLVNVPRKGYRLIAAVRMVSAPAPSLAFAPLPAPAAAIPVTPGAALVVELPRALPIRRWHWPPPIVLGSLLSVLLAVGSLIGTRLLRYDPSAESVSIVVLPFIDMTVDKADQPFCDGLTEELSNWLSQIPTLRVVARTSAFAFRGRGEDVRKIGAALDTNHILQGSMRRSGDHVRITVQLIDARDGYHLWSENFEMEPLIAKCSAAL